MRLIKSAGALSTDVPLQEPWACLPELAEMGAHQRVEQQVGSGRAGREGNANPHPLRPLPLCAGAHPVAHRGLADLGYPHPPFLPF